MTKITLAKPSTIRKAIDAVEREMEELENQIFKAKLIGSTCLRARKKLQEAKKTRLALNNKLAESILDNHTL